MLRHAAVPCVCLLLLATSARAQGRALPVVNDLTGDRTVMAPQGGGTVPPSPFTPLEGRPGVSFSNAATQCRSTGRTAAAGATP